MSSARVPCFLEVLAWPRRGNPGKRIATIAPTPKTPGKRGLALRTFDRRLFGLLLLLLAPCAPLAAQTIEDGLFMPKKTLCTGFLYTHDSWDEYWEGTLKRTNGNIGSITTEVNTIAANYGVFDRFNLIGTVPYVWTRASQGRPSWHRGLSGSDAGSEVERAREANDQLRHAAHDRRRLGRSSDDGLQP